MGSPGICDAYASLLQCVSEFVEEFSVTFASRDEASGVIADADRLRHDLVQAKFELEMLRDAASLERRRHADTALELQTLRRELRAAELSCSNAAVEVEELRRSRAEDNRNGVVDVAAATAEAAASVRSLIEHHDRVHQATLETMLRIVEKGEDEERPTKRRCTSE